MATRLYSASIGGQVENDANTNITEAVGSATVTTSIELTVDFAVVTDKMSVIRALEKFQDYLLESAWPPV